LQRKLGEKIKGIYFLSGHLSIIQINDKINEQFGGLYLVVGGSAAGRL
jgi:hypothetical protein